MPQSVSILQTGFGIKENQTTYREQHFGTVQISPFKSNFFISRLYRSPEYSYFSSVFMLVFSIQNDENGNELSYCIYGSDGLYSRRENEYDENGNEIVVFFIKLAPYYGS